MNQRKKVISVIAVTVMLLSLLPLAAQQSNTNKATAFNFETDVDNYMSVNDYSKVEMEKGFGFLNVNASRLDLGYARTIAGLYFGTYYYGRILQQDSRLESTAVTTTPSITNGVITSTTTVTTKTIANESMDTFNDFNVLVGVAKMGFKLGFYENMKTYKNLSTPVTISSVTEYSGPKSKVTDEYTDISRVDGTMIPSLTWGMNLGLGEMTLKPTAYVGVEIITDSEAYTRNQNTTVLGQIALGSTATTTTYSKNDGYVAPKVMLGAELEFAKKEAAQTTVGLFYSLGIPLYGDGNKEVTTVVNTTETLTERTNTSNETVTTTAVTGLNNYISPRFAYSKDLSDRLSIGFNTNASVTLNSKTETNGTIDVTNKYSFNSFSQDPADDYVTTTVTSTPAATVNTSSFMVSPTLNTGFTYEMVKGKFTLNGGLKVNAPSFKSTTTKTTRSASYKQTVKTVLGDGTVTTDTVSYSGGGTSVDLEDARKESSEVTTEWSGLNANLSTGCTFNFTPNFALDALMNFGGATVSLMGGTDGLFTRSLSLMFTMKY